VRDFLNDPTSRPRVSLVKAILAEFLKMARMFDSSSQFLNCFVYSSYSALPETIKIVLANPSHIKTELNLSNAFFNDLADIVASGWEKFHHPVYSAGFVLCHLHIDALRALMVTDNAEFKSLLQDTVLVLSMMFCRWAPTALTTRKVPLELDDHDVLQFGDNVCNELEDFAAGTGNWQDFNFSTFDCDSTDPRRFWTHKAPPTILNEFAVRIVCLDPVSSDVERLHKITKANRTKTRSRLKYTVNQALSFGKLQLIHSNNPPKGLSWADLRGLHNRMMTVTDDEDQWAQLLHEKWANEARSIDVKEEEGVLSPEDDNGNVQSDEEHVGSEPEVSHVIAERGRRRRSRIFNDFVRLDNDGGLAD